MMDTPATSVARLALHACCGPCLIEPLDALISEGARPVIVFANPNIAPRDEYRLRRDVLLDHASARGIEVVELDVGHGVFLDAVSGLDRPMRCRACYRLRLTLVSEWAASNGCEGVATTLTVSPYQDPEAIRQEGEECAATAGIEYLDRDFRDRYGEATRRSRALGMYRQNYCGCAMSMKEAHEEREVRRAERRARRESSP
jgi:hypothetical protein